MAISWRAVSSVGRPGEGIHALLVGHIGVDVNRLPAAPADILHRFFAVQDVRDDDLPSLRGDGLCVDPPDAPGRSGDDDDAILKPQFQPSHPDS